MSNTFNKEHPYGKTLLSRDKPGNGNLEKWGPQGVGYVDIDPSVLCTPPHCPHYHYRDDAEHSGAVETPIHLLIASFRDQLCPRTLDNAFRRAENPQRIFVRVIEQTESDSDLIDDAGCFARYCTDYNTNCQEYKHQVRTIHMDAAKAKGPTDARSKLSAMIAWDYEHRNDPQQLDFVPVQLQDFCLQTDSHMDFSDNYDTELIYMHHRTQNDYAVLSTYVTDISQNNRDVRTVPNLCMVTFTSTIRNWGTKECIQLVTPKLTNAMWGAGLSFHRCHAEINVPIDPYLDGVFDGEEGSRGIRFFTHGYDVYTPDRVLVTHDYQKHQSNPVVHSWGHHQHNHDEPPPRDVYPFTEAMEAARPDLQTVGVARVNMLLGIGAPDSDWDADELDRIRNGRFGLGTRRSLEQAVEFTGIDLRNRDMVKNKCGNLAWVPFEETSDREYGIPEVLQRGLTTGKNNNQRDAVAAAAAAPVLRGLDLTTRRRVASANNNAGSSGSVHTTTATLLGGVAVAAVGVVVWKLARRPRKKGNRHTI